MKDFLLKKMALPTVVLVWAAIYYAETMKLSLPNHRMIQPIFWVLVALYFINGFTDFREWKSAQAHSSGKEQPAEKSGINRQQIVKCVTIVGAMIALVALMNVLGFLIGAFLFAVGALFVMGERKWYKLLFIPLTLVIVVYCAFHIGLSIPFPTGIFGI